MSDERKKEEYEAIWVAVMEEIERKVQLWIDALMEIWEGIPDVIWEKMAEFYRMRTCVNVILMAMWDLHGFSEIQYGRDGKEYFWMADIRKWANTRLRDRAEEEMSAPQVGKFIRELGFEVGKRQGKGIPVMWDRDLHRQLCEKWVDDEWE